MGLTSVIGPRNRRFSGQFTSTLEEQQRQASCHHTWEPAHLWLSLGFPVDFQCSKCKTYKTARKGQKTPCMTHSTASLEPWNATLDYIWSHNLA